MREVNRLNEDPEFREYISYEENQRKIQNTLLSKAKEEGLKQGIKQNKLVIAKEMLKDKMNINIISKYTNLSIEEINNLSKK